MGSRPFFEPNLRTWEINFGVPKKCKKKEMCMKEVDERICGATCISDAVFGCKVTMFASELFECRSNDIEERRKCF